MIYRHTCVTAALARSLSPSRLHTSVDSSRSRRTSLSRGGGWGVEVYIYKYVCMYVSYVSHGSKYFVVVVSP